ncbi:glutamate-1-semialdehyde 2,1-aminomutase [Fusibacter paucivorans]|uniref:Glutamate-1-semialdehyde 2,1-aminomutase n=1 Tax=Fusibacter paucivorans TaxID=76009 RepID=A0ABS5PS08_9FIRM|nr:glutamate-1-semialdehyde 2,1-aminomutase [Fusibacter paucivorans]MBS7527151.1 glutamate-1-semialdehyde 2,1-aminomutase [Fusibacter paucivorans]
MHLNHEKSEALFERAKAVIPGGVNSPVRAFKSVGINPIFIERGEGPYIYDVDGNRYIDLICSWGPLILGHSHPALLDGIEKIFQKGTSYGVPSHLEVTMAEMIAEAYPAAERVRMVNSGTEATMSAIRVARGYTGRQKILKFEGCYHGHSDALLVKSGSGTLTYGVPTSPGVPADTVKDTLVGIYNDVEMLESLFAAQGSEIACAIVEVVAGNMGVVPATEAFMAALRRLSTAYGVVLIFDEVITGFRLAYGGASEIYRIDPDMVCFGKIIGGGLPVGAYAGKSDIMAMVSPVGPVYQAGTLSGNPLAMHMGIQTLQYLKAHPELYLQLEEKASYLASEMAAFIETNELPVTFTRFHSMPCLFFAKGPFKCYDDVKNCDTEAYATYFRKMLDKGVLLPPAQFEGLFLSISHDDSVLETYLNASKSTLLEMYK